MFRKNSLVLNKGFLGSSTPAKVTSYFGSMMPAGASSFSFATPTATATTASRTTEQPASSMFKSLTSSCAATTTTSSAASSIRRGYDFNASPLGQIMNAKKDQLRAFSSTSVDLARGAGHSSSGSNNNNSSGGYMQANYAPQTTSSSGGSQSTADSLTPQVRSHLVRVYNLLAAGVATTAVGSVLMMMTPLGKMIPWFVPSFGGMIPLFWLMWKPPASIQGRLALFFTFTFLEGMAIAPLVKMTLAKGVLGSALVMTGAVFVGFSAAAYLSPRASMLAFQGPLIGMLFGLIGISLFNMIWPSAFAHSLMLYGGLAIFSALVAVDTQAMIERARCGAGDHVQDALQMFLNVINIFTRIAQILGMSSD